MKVFTSNIETKTKGKTDIVDITDTVRAKLAESKLASGIACIFVVGSTAAITTIEYEPALVKDTKQILEKLIPSGVSYAHDDTWGDANGYSHLRATLLGPSLSVPFMGSELSLGTWQQIILIDFDNRPRTRKLILQFMGE